MDTRKKILIISDSAKFVESVIDNKFSEAFDVTSTFSYSDGFQKAQSGEFMIVVIEDLIEHQKLSETIQHLDSSKFEKCIIVSAEPALYSHLINEKFLVLNSRTNSNIHEVISALLK